MLQFIYAIVIWVIVPDIIISMLFLGVIIIANAPSSNLRTSATAGFIAGFVVFVVYVVSQLQIPQDFGLSLQHLPKFSWFDSSTIISLASGFATGFCLLWIVDFATPKKLIGPITLILSGASTSALFSYYFAVNARILTIFFTLCLLVGVLLHIMFFPESIQLLTPHGPVQGARLTRRLAPFGRIRSISVARVLIGLSVIFTIINFILAIVSLYQ
jgi:hypothetical protein